jgi:ParB/RepB/Spo0J family partition protein
MHLIPIDKILVPSNRQRQEFNPEAIGELATSIARLGLLHPLVIRYDSEHDEVMLVAGERRLRAYKHLKMLSQTTTCNGQTVPVGVVPCLALSEMSEEMVYEAELDENIRRQDLTWQERAQALSRLNELRQRKNPAFSAADLSEEVKGNRNNPNLVAAELVVARNLADPDVSAAKSVGDAFKILVRKEQEKKNTLHAAIVGKTFSSADHTLLMGDCLEVMVGLPQSSFDVILTDPPYGMGADAFGDAAGKLLTINHGYSDDSSSFRRLLVAAEAEIHRVAKPAAHLYICCDIDQFFWLRELFSTNWKVFRTPLINCKINSGRVPLPEHGPRRCWEAVLYAYRGDRKCTAIYSDVISSQGDENLGHGAQKPVGLFVDLLKRSARSGDSVLDPFCGTGTIFEAAHGLKVSATGIEQEAKYFGIAAQRIERLK